MPHKVVAFSGALEKNSPNSGLIRACLQAQHPQLQIRVFDISTFPLFNLDIILQSGYPPQVQQFRDAITESDGVIIAVSQHNEKVSAALKNGYDWASFAMGGSSPIRQKPAGLISAGSDGGIKGQNHFRQVGAYCKVKIMEHSLKVEQDGSNFDGQGNVISDHVRGETKTFLHKFEEFLSASKA